jgi:Kelch motif.
MKTSSNFVQRAIVLVALALNLFLIQPAHAASWATNSPMLTARQNHTATLLPNGNALVAGGWNGNIALASAELFDPATGKWIATGTMTTNRYYHTATLLPNGKVLVVGGKAGGTTLSSAELYDPNTGAWTNTGTLHTSRNFHTATLLPNGQVLVTGGYNGNVLSSAELYDPATGTWTATNSMNTVRGNHTATLLPNGQVLVAGGWNGDISNIGLASAELYDPGTGTWTTTNAMNTARQNHTATVLPNGQVLVAGGAGSSGTTNSAELFDPSIGTWATTGSLTNGRMVHTANLLPNGKVLITGGSKGSTLSSTELYDLVSGKWTTNVAMNISHQSHTATLLADGKLLIAGGIGPSGVTNRVEVYDSANGTWTNTGAMTTGRFHHSATLLPNGKVLVAGGANSSDYFSSAELYDTATGTNTLTSEMITARFWHTATLLANGKVLVAGGDHGSLLGLSSAELYDPLAGSWTNTGVLNIARYVHTATLLLNGKVLVAGGVGSNGYLSSAELYDPATETWMPTGSLTNSREFHTATLLPNGKVLVTGGSGSSGYLSKAEIYDPATGKWAATDAMTTVRIFHTATLLPNGKVLVAGGWTNQFGGSTLSISSAELYDPATGTWTNTGPLITGRGEHTATLLPNGKVLVVGGLRTAGPNNSLSSVELYDPATGKWTATGALTGARQVHTATLVPDGKVLVTGGGDSSGSPLASIELYDVGLGFSNSWQPQITAFSSPFSLGGSLVISGSQFRGISGASGGNTQDSPTDYPLVQLRSMESGPTTFLLATNWSTNSFTSLPVWNFPPGYALATVFVNGIQSTSSIVNISVPIPTTTVLTDAKKTTNGFQFAFTNSPGAIFGVLASTNLALPLTNWTALGGVMEISPGQFQFTDSQATNNPKRFYLIRSP